MWFGDGEMWCILGMNVNIRELMEHVEYEPEFYYAAFSAELEICSSTMWSLLIHLNDEVFIVIIIIIIFWVIHGRKQRNVVPYNVISLSLLMQLS